MKIKDITISIFAIIGFVTILSSFNNQTHDTVPESHIWEFYDTGANFALNKVTGEVRKYNGFTPEIGKDGKLLSRSVSIYTVMTEATPK